MRVGLFHTDLPQPGLKPGGVALGVHRLANALVARGHAVTFWSFDRAPADAAYTHVRLGDGDRAPSRLARAGVVPRALNRVDFSSVDVLHLQGDDWLFLRRRLPTVRTLNGSAMQEARSATSLKRRLWQSLNAAFEMVASRVATRTYGLGPGVGRPLRTHGCLDLGIELPDPPSLTTAPRPTVAFVGTWDGRKRGRLLWQAFHDHVLPAHPGAELVMVSDHAEPSPHVRWLTAPSDAEVAAVFAAAHVFCLPSRYEGFGIPYLEAMAHRCAVVASDNPGARHVLGPALAGQIVADAALGPEIARLLADEHHHADVVARGAERAQAFGWDAVVAAHVAAYEDAIAAWRR